MLEELHEVSKGLLKKDFFKILPGGVSLTL